jgi:hypothetical protein
MRSIIRLSTISITVMESVSEANASGIAVARATCALKRGSIVSGYPKKKARTTAKAMEAKLPYPRASAMISPSTSPMAQPVRQ